MAKDLGERVYSIFANHRSIRKFKQVEIPDRDLEMIMEAGRRAPTDASLHLWTAVRIKDRGLRRKISDLIGQEHVYTASEFFVFLADLYRLKSLLEHRGRSMGDVDYALFIFAAVDAALAAENMAIMAESLGYGICFIGGVQAAAEEIIDLLELPEKTYPLFGLVIGVPDEMPELRPRLPRSIMFHENKYRRYSSEDLDLSFRAMASYPGVDDWIRILDRYAGIDGVFVKRNKTIPELLKKQGFRLS